MPINCSKAQELKRVKVLFLTKPTVPAAFYKIAFFLAQQQKINKLHKNLLLNVLQPF